MAWQNNQWGSAYGQAPGMYQQGPMRPMQQQSMDWIRVPDTADFERVAVQPGQTAWIMAQNASVFGVRSADNMGMVRTRYFRFEEYDPAAADQQRQAGFEERLRRLEALAYGDQSAGGRFQAPAEQAGQQPAANAGGI